jgi:arginase
VQRAIAEYVENAARRGHRPVIIAGDCCASIGVAAGLQRAGFDPVLVWLDAHGDFNTWETTPSGFIGGMPLAMLVGRGEQTLMHAVGVRPFEEDRVILTDARDLDPDEKQALQDSRVNLVTDFRAMCDHPLASQPLWIHFDVDLVNPDDAPAMSYRAPGGPSAALVRTLFHTLAQTARIVAVSVSTWNPELDPDGRTQSVCMELLENLTGHTG